MTETANSFPTRPAPPSAKPSSPLITEQARQKLLEQLRSEMQSEMQSEMRSQHRGLSARVKQAETDMLALDRKMNVIFGNMNMIERRLKNMSQMCLGLIVLLIAVIATLLSMR